MNMNKKSAALLISMLVIPLFAFGYAHYTDTVEKKYKIHVGSIIANVTYFHVDKLKTIDVDGDGVIWGDEVVITIYSDPATCKQYVLIALNPIPPSFELDTTLQIHNDGKLPWEAYWLVRYAGPFDYDYYGCFEGWDTGDFTDLAVYPPDGVSKEDPPFQGVPGWYIENGLIYDINFWKSGNLVNPTEELYYPCQNLTVTQNITLLQTPSPPVTDPNGVLSSNWQKNIQCHWFLIWVEIVVQNPTPQTFTSATWNGTDWTIPPGFP